MLDFRSHQSSKLRALNDSRLQFELDTMSMDGNCELMVTQEFSGPKVGISVTHHVSGYLF